MQHVAEDIYQVRIPLPFALNHVYCYLLDDGQGHWSVVDTGLNTSKARAIWQTVFTTLEIDPATIHQIILTHAHPDHFGLSGWFQSFSGAPVHLSPDSTEFAQHLWIEGDWLDASADLHWKQCGIPEAMYSIISSTENTIRMKTMPHPSDFALLIPNTEIQIGRRTCQIIHAPGHSDGQVIFYDAEGQLIFCGDQVLNKISPNIGLWPKTQPNPLGRYLASLDDLTNLNVQLALPGHGPLIRHWQERLGELSGHHAKRLDQMQAIAKDGATAYEVTKQAFNMDRLSEHEQRFAVAETFAHLEYLADTATLIREDRAGVMHYRQP